MFIPNLDDPKFMDGFKKAVDEGKGFEFIDGLCRIVTRDNRSRAAKQHAIDAAAKRAQFYKARGIPLD